MFCFSRKWSFPRIITFQKVRVKQLTLVIMVMKSLWYKELNCVFRTAGIFLIMYPTGIQTKKLRIEHRLTLLLMSSKDQTDYQPKEKDHSPCNKPGVFFGRPQLLIL